MSAVVRFISKIVGILTSPFRNLFVTATVLLLLEFLKFFTVLLAVFGIVYTIFLMRSILSDNSGTARKPITSAPHSTIEMEQGNVSNYPYVVELPSRASATSFK